MLIKETDNGVVFKVRIQPNAKKNRINGLVGDSLKICVCSPPVDGAANTACIKYLSNLLNVSKSKIEIISGEKSRNKILLVKGISKDILLKMIDI